MSTKFHAILQAEDGIHTIVAFDFINEAARLTYVPLDSDEGKIARQLNDNSYWLLLSRSPIQWLQIKQATWGDIAGNIDDQTDLVNQLNALDSDISQVQTNLNNEISNLTPAWVQRVNSLEQSSNDLTWVSLNIGTQVETNPGSLFTVLGTTVTSQFTGFLKITYSLSITETGNSRGSEARILKNGSQLLGSLKHNSGNSLTSFSTVSHSQITACAPGSTFEVQFRTSSARQLSTLPINAGYLRIEKVSQ